MLVNFIATKMAPKSIVALAKAATEYPAWKSKPENKPDYKPWNTTEIFLPTLPAEMQGPIPEKALSQISSEQLSPEDMAAAEEALEVATKRNSVEMAEVEGGGDGGDAGGGAALGAEPGLLGAEPGLLPKVVEL